MSSLVSFFLPILQIYQNKHEIDRNGAKLADKDNYPYMSENMKKNFNLKLCMYALLFRTFGATAS